MNQIDLKIEILRLVRGLRNGMYYGGKIRFMHSLVIMILFGKGNIFKRIKTILKNTINHAINLGAFVLTFKSAKLILKIIFNEKHW